MDAICLHRKIVCEGLHPQKLQKTVHFFGKSGGHIRIDHVVDLSSQPALVADTAFFGEEAPIDADHGMLSQKGTAESRLFDLLAVEPFRPFVRFIHLFLFCSFVFIFVLNAENEPVKTDRPVTSRLVHGACAPASFAASLRTLVPECHSPEIRYTPLRSLGTERGTL